MPSFNRVILVGNLTRDPELRYIPSGKAVAEIGLAVNARRKSASGDWVDETTFVDITLWERQAEIAGEYLSKGSPVLVEGRLKLDTWETDGQKRSKMRVVGDRIEMLGTRGGGDGGGGSYSRSASQSSPSRAPVQNSAPQEDYDYGPPPGEDVPF